MSRIRFRSLAGVLSGLITVGALAGACSTSGSSATSTTPSSTTVPPSITQTSMVINGKTVTVPREEYTQNRPIEGQVDDGGQIIITKHGVLPISLTGPTPVTITFTNLTTKPVTVTIAASGKKSPSIAPGGHWSISYKSPGSAANFAYMTSNGYSGSVSVGELPMPPIPTTTLP